MNSLEKFPQQPSFKSSPLSSLESPVFPSSIEKNLFTEWLAKNDHIIPVFEARREFDARKGNIFIPTSSGEKDSKPVKGFGTYILYLPDDMKIGELPALIRRINRMTFGEHLPDYASVGEMQVKIVCMVDALLRKISSNTSARELDATKKTLTKYYLLYIDLFGSSQAQKLSDPSYRDLYIQIANNHEKYRAFQEKIIRIRTAEKVSDFHTDMESLLSTELVRHLDESIYERGVAMIRGGLETITQAEQEFIRRKALQDGYIESKDDPSLLTRGKESISFRAKTTTLDQQGRYLRDAIGIDFYIKALKGARASGDRKKIAEIELSASNAIARELYKYPYRNISSNGGYTPRGVVDHKEVYCVGFSLIGHAMLSELGIVHQGLDIPHHSALSLDIGGTQYYLDGTFKDSLSPYTFTGIRQGESRQGTLSLVDGSYSTTIIRGDTEYILQSHIYGNLGNDFNKQQRYPEAVIAYQKAIELNPKDLTVYYNLGTVLSKQQKYPQAIMAYKKAIELNPRNSNAYYNLGAIFVKQQKYPEAIISYQKAIELSPYDLSGYINLGGIFFTLGRYPEAIDIYNKAISLNIHDGDIYNNLGIIFRKQQKYPEAIVMYQKAIELDPKNANAYANLGVVLSKQKKYPEALASYQKAIELDPNDVIIYKNFGMIIAEYIGEGLLGELFGSIHITPSGEAVFLDTHRAIDPKYGREKVEMQQFLEKKDYRGLYKYILSFLDKNPKK